MSARIGTVHPVNSERLQRYTTEHLRRELQASFKRFIQTWSDPSNRRDFSRKSTSSPSPVTPADTHMASRYTHVYTVIKKSEWFDHLSTYYSLAQNKTGKSKPMGVFRTDYSTELRSLKSDDWFLKEGITFEPSAPHSQEQNGVSERTGRTIMDMTRCTIIEGFRTIYGQR